MICVGREVDYRTLVPEAPGGCRRWPGRL